MKKIMIFAVISLLLVSMLGVTASAAGFNPQGAGVTHVTGYDFFKYANEGSLIVVDGDADVTSPNMYYIQFDMEPLGYSRIEYCCSPNPTSGSPIWDNYLANESKLYTANYYILEVKNKDAIMGIAPMVIPFNNTGSTAYVGITGNDEDYPIALVDYKGKVSRGETIYSVDRFLINIPANFEGYVVIPYDRLTSDIANDDPTLDGDIRDYQNAGYRFFWSLGMFVENFDDLASSFQYVNVYVADNSLDLDIPAASKPTQAPTKEPTKEPTTAPTTAPTQAPTQAVTKEPTKAPTNTKAPVTQTTQPGTDITQEPTLETTEDITLEPTQETTPEVTPEATPEATPVIEQTEAPTQAPTKNVEDKKVGTVWINLTYFIIFIVIAAVIIIAEAVIIFLLLKKMKDQSKL